MAGTEGDRQRCPERVEEFLDEASTRCLAFNRRGTLLAGGSADGTITIWDFDTRGVVRVLSHDRDEDEDVEMQDPSGHSAGAPGAESSAAPVLRVQWSRDGKKILSCTAKEVHIWDVLTGAVEWFWAASRWTAKRDNTTIVSASFEPRRYNQVVVTFSSGPPLLLRFHLNTWDEGNDNTRTIQLDSAYADHTPGGASAALRGRTVACFSPQGDVVLVGTQTGAIAAIHPPAGAPATKGGPVLPAVAGDVLVLAPAEEGGSPPAVEAVTTDRSGRHVLATCNDKTIRVLSLRSRGVDWTPQSRRLSEVASPEAAPAPVGVSPLGPDQALLKQVAVLRSKEDDVAWKPGVRPATCDYAHGPARYVAAAASGADHVIYVFEIDKGEAVLRKVLEAARGKTGDLEAMDMAWHPLWPNLVVATAAGPALIWAPHYHERWAAFAPGFIELKENKEHVESEDEFDLSTKDANDQAADAAVGGGAAEDDAASELDFDTAPVAGKVLSSDDEEDLGQGALHYLPLQLMGRRADDDGMDEDDDDDDRASGDETGTATEKEEDLGRGSRKRKQSVRMELFEDPGKVDIDALRSAGRGRGRGRGSMPGRGLVPRVHARYLPALPPASLWGDLMGPKHG
ncbi:unnamed protein product [Pedinophyceae sp. YPF-701]|nr:unnamed protein product [Pedinophyceae sp. YPF-701]